MGFDNINLLSYIEPEITTVSVPIADVGKSAVNTLINGITSGIVESMVLPHEIVPGQSII